MPDVLIVDGARTPMGGLLGDLADATASELGTSAIAATLERASVAPDAVVPASCFIGPNVVIESGARLGERVHLLVAPEAAQRVAR